MANADAAAAHIRVEVVYSPRPGEVDCSALVLATPATVDQALRASAMLARHGLDAQHIKVGIWGRVVAADTLLRDRDRVEIYRPLIVDPKEARRLRYKRHRKEPAAQ